MYFECILLECLMCSIIYNQHYPTKKILESTAPSQNKKIDQSYTITQTFILNTLLY